jgi:predicted PolB exonuclease-like 3'-5' exonuclease
MHANFDNKHVNDISFIDLFISSDGSDCNSIVRWSSSKTQQECGGHFLIRIISCHKDILIFSCLVDDLGFGGLLGSMEFR